MEDVAAAHDSDALLVAPVPLCPPQPLCLAIVPYIAPPPKRAYLDRDWVVIGFPSKIKDSSSDDATERLEKERLIVKRLGSSSKDCKDALIAKCDKCLGCHRAWRFSECTIGKDIWLCVEAGGECSGDKSLKRLKREHARYFGETLKLTAAQAFLRMHLPMVQTRCLLMNGQVKTKSNGFARFPPILTRKKAMKQHIVEISWLPCNCSLTNLPAASSC